MTRAISLLFAASLSLAVAPVAAAPSPAGLVSRAEALKAVVESSPALRARLAAYREHMPPLPLYLDVPQQNALSPYLEAAFEQAVILGNRERAFRPTEPITVEELTAMYARAAAVHDERAAVAVATQSPTEPWYAPAQRALALLGHESPKHLGTGAFAARRSFAFMTAQLSAFALAHPRSDIAASSVPAQQQPQPQPQPQQVSSSVASAPSVASRPAVPQYLPVRLNPLPVPQAQPSPQAGTIVAAQSPSVVTDASSFGEIRADPAPGGNAFIDVVSAAQPVMINAGGTDAPPDAGNGEFTITIPSLGIGPIPVATPDDPFSHNGLLAPLQAGLGHLFGNPGGGGKILVYGHSSSYPWDTSPYTKIFRRINELNPGDEVLITYGGQEYRYRVTFEETVPAKDMSAYQDDGSGEDLILYTCWPPDSITQRYLVHAKPV